MTDKELLEYAARASCIELDWNIPERCKSPWIADSSMQWNPLTDDGDALRLAVKLGLCVYCGYEQAEVRDYDESFVRIEDYADNKDAATRRAIVRAAAEIGKSHD